MTAFREPAPGGLATHAVFMATPPFDAESGLTAGSGRMIVTASR